VEEDLEPEASLQTTAAAKWPAAQVGFATARLELPGVVSLEKETLGGCPLLTFLLEG